jgi:hypothetical protein
MGFQNLEVEDWMDEIDLALKFRREYGVESSWAPLEALFYNQDKTALAAGPNIVYSTGDSLISALCVPNPNILVKPTRLDSIMGSRMVEQQDNSIMKECKIRHAVDRVLLHVYLHGKGIGKIGYDSEWGYDPDLDIGGKQNPQGMTFSQYDRKFNRMEFDSEIRPGMPWVRAVAPHDFLVPYGTTDLRDAMWAAHRVIRHIDFIKEDPRYDRKDLEPSLSRRDFVNSYKSVLQVHRLGTDMSVRTGRYNSTDGSENLEYVELWEIHDKRTGKIIVVADGHDKFLRNEPDALQINGLPFVDMSLVERSRAFWTTPDALYVRSHQKELSDIAIQKAEQRRASTLKLLYDKKIISGAELDKLMSARVGLGIGIDTTAIPDGNLKNAIMLFNPQGVNQGLYQEELSVRAAAQESVGMGANQSGQYDAKTHRSATEAGIVQQNSSMRLSRRGSLVRDFYTELFEKINPIIFKFWTQPRLMEVIGPTGLPQWVAATGADMQGNYRIEVNMSSEPELSRQSRQQLAAQMYTALSQDPTVDQIQLRRYLAGAFNDVEFSSIFKPGVLQGGIPVTGSVGSDPAGTVASNVPEIEDQSTQEPAGAGGEGVQ